MNGKRINSQTSTKQTKAQRNEKAGSAENILAMKRLLKTKTYKVTSSHFPPFRLR